MVITVVSVRSSAICNSTQIHKYTKAFFKDWKPNMKLVSVISLLLVASASAFVPAVKFQQQSATTASATTLFNGPVIGKGGMADTRDPDAFQHDDPRKSISEAPSFEEYLKMRGEQPAAAETAAPAVAAPAPAPAASTSTSTPAVSGGDPIATLDASQKASVDKIVASIPDLSTHDLSWPESAGMTTAGCPTTIDAYDAPGKSNVAWLASVCVKGKMSSLTIFNGPLTDVPHLLSRCCLLDDGKLSFSLDFRPRAYGAYEMVDADGNYPGPEELGRKAFEYSGNRKEYFSKFADDSVKAYLDEALASFEGATPVEPSELDQLTGGPLAIALTMPATDANIAAVTAVREKAAASWLQWALEDTHEHRPGAPINTQYVYDSKFRLNCYGALFPFYESVFGAGEGKELAVAESGPLDEAYVGGGS
jgi:hypothetical protein